MPFDRSSQHPDRLLSSDQLHAIYVLRIHEVDDGWVRFVTTRRIIAFKTLQSLKRWGYLEHSLTQQWRGQTYIGGCVRLTERARKLLPMIHKRTVSEWYLSERPIRRRTTTPVMPKQVVCGETS